MFFCKYTEDTVSLICIWLICEKQRSKHKLSHRCCGFSIQDSSNSINGAVSVKFQLCLYNTLQREWLPESRHFTWHMSLEKTISFGNKLWEELVLLLPMAHEQRQSQS